MNFSDPWMLSCASIHSLGSCPVPRQREQATMGAPPMTDVMVVLRFH